MIYTCHGDHQTGPECVCVCPTGDVCVFSDSPVASVLTVVYAGCLPLLVLCCRLRQGCFSYSGLSLHDPRSHAKIQAVSNESRVPAVYFRERKKKKTESGLSVSLSHTCQAGGRECEK